MRFPDSVPKVEELIAGQAWPIGSVFISVVATNPAILLGIGTWTAFATGRVLVGIDPGDTDFDTAEKTSGAKTVTLTSNEMPAHTHVQNAHGHTQDPHNHGVTDPTHNHTQNSHTHPSIQVQGNTTAVTTGTHIMTSTATGGSSRAATAPEAANAATATNNATTTGVTVNNATATNQSTTAVNQNAGGGAAHNNVQASIAVFMWKRVA